MGWFFNKKEEEVRANDEEPAVSDPLLSALTGSANITDDEALSIPAFSSAIERVCDTVSLVQIKLYKETDGKVEEVKDDVRVRLLNDDTGDTLDGCQFKKAMIRDYLLYGNAYAYINRKKNTVKSIHYVEQQEVNVIKGVDPIFKEYKILVRGKEYKDFDFIKLTRNSKNGVEGIGIIEESNKALNIAHATMKFELNLVSTGGNKKGFLKSAKKLSEEALQKLKEAWRKLYSSSQENVIILNDGLEFQESSNTSVEMQLSERKKTMKEDINDIFKIKPNGTYLDFVKEEVLPILEALTVALNKDLLLEREKGSYYFACDTKNIMKADIQARYNAYKTALDSGWISKNEIRYEEDLEQIDGLDVVVLSLGNVLYDIKTGKYYTPNTGQVINLEEVDSDKDTEEEKEEEIETVKGGVEDEGGSESE